MKICLVAHTIPKSGISGASIGISKYVMNLSDQLRRLGNEVELFIRNDIRPKENWIKPIYSPKFAWIPYPFFVFPKIVSAEADIYHADYVTTGSPLAIANKRPLVVTVHDAIPFTYNLEEMTVADRFRVWWYMKNFKLIEKADAIILVSEHARQEAIKYTNIPEEKIFAVHYGADFDRLYQKKKKISDVIKIGYLGGLDGRKNVILLIKSFQELVKKYDNIELHVGGGGENLQRFKDMNIPKSYFYGPIKFDDVNDFLNKLDIFVFPSLQEGFGFPPLEAMTCGIPVVATISGPMPEIVDGAGILVEPNVHSMVKGISKLLENRSLRKRLTRAGLKRVKKFTWEKCAKETLKVYETAMRR